MCQPPKPDVCFFVAFCAKCVVYVSTVLWSLLRFLSFPFLPFPFLSFPFLSFAERYYHTYSFPFRLHTRRSQQTQPPSQQQFPKTLRAEAALAQPAPPPVGIAPSNKSKREHQQAGRKELQQRRRRRRPRPRPREVPPGRPEESLWRDAVQALRRSVFERDQRRRQVFVHNVLSSCVAKTLWWNHLSFSRTANEDAASGCRGTCISQES